jgi:hypothetical protein
MARRSIHSADIRSIGKEKEIERSREEWYTIWFATHLVDCGQNPFMDWNWWL